MTFVKVNNAVVRMKWSLTNMLDSFFYTVAFPPFKQDQNIDKEVKFKCVESLNRPQVAEFTILAGTDVDQTVIEATRFLPYALSPICHCAATLQGNEATRAMSCKGIGSSWLRYRPICVILGALGHLLAFYPY
jgi:hypothetical protein